MVLPPSPPLPFPRSLVSQSLRTAGWEAGQALGWSPSGWFLPSRSIPAHPRGIPMCPTATSQGLVVSMVGLTLTPEAMASARAGVVQLCGAPER